MLLEIVLGVVTLVVLGAASYTDIRTREVPDWLNFAFLIGVLGIRGIFSLQYGWQILLSGMLGLLVCFLLANLLYYTWQWGGGDSKLLMGMGASIGVVYPLTAVSFNLPLFFIGLLLFGAVYGLIWMGVIAVLNRKRFLLQFQAKMKEKYVFHYMAVGISLAFGVVTWFVHLFWPFIVLPLLFFYLLLFVSCIEEEYFHKRILPARLTEGDWLAEEIRSNNRLLFQPKTLEREDLIVLQKMHGQGKLPTVLIKEGIPFVPSFLLAYVALLMGGYLVVLMTGLF